MVDFRELYEKAYAAGLAAGKAALPTPMIVGEAQALVGPGSDKIDYSKETYYCESGVCGFAWVVVPGNSPFGRWAKKAGVARPGYPKGIHFWVREFGQSMERKEAFARAFAKVLKEAGVQAYSDSRMD